jgi:putative ABC transport system permease protein
MDNLLQDLRFALRTMLKSPGFTLLAVLAIGLGIGANTAIFTVVNAVLLKPLPYAHSERLLKVWGKLAKENIPQNWLSQPEYLELHDTNQSFSDVAAFAPGNGANLTRGSGEPLRVTATYATASLLPMLGVQPTLGRTYSADEDQPGRDQVVVLSNATWRSQFGSDPNILGKSVSLDGKAYSIIGVLPNDFSFSKPADIWLPLALDRTKPPDRGSHYLNVLGQLKPGVTFAQASEDMDRFARRLAQEYPTFYRAETGWGVFVRPLQEEVVGKVDRPLRVLLGAVALVLLIACANVANLLLVKASAREREIAIRTALGASHGRLLRQLFTETALLSLFGGALGLALAFVGTRFLVAISPANLPRMNDIHVDMTVLLFTAGVSLMTGLLFGIAPGMHVMRSNPNESLKDVGKGGSVGVASQRARSALVVSEMALSLVLLIAAGLMIRSFYRLTEVDPGFRGDHLLTMHLSLPDTTYPDGVPVTSFYSEVTRRVQQLPGVKDAGAISELPMSGAHSSASVTLKDASLPAPTHQPNTGLPYIEADRRFATPGYFPALQIAVREGRTFTDADSTDAPLVAVVDTEFADRFWPGKSPIGRKIAINAGGGVKVSDIKWRTIVGVVAHVNHDSLEVKGREQVYFPHTQRASARDMYLAIRTNSDPAALASAVRHEVRAIDANQPIYDVATMDQLLQSSLAQPRFNLVLLSIFAALALFLASIGIYGVLSYLVSLRWHELGIRMALGAQKTDVLRIVLQHGIKLVMFGLGIGIGAAWLATRVLASMLFEVSQTDLLTFTAIPAVFIAVATFATLVPAIRATKVEPIIALRHE